MLAIRLAFATDATQSSYFHFDHSRLSDHLAVIEKYRRRLGSIHQIGLNFLRLATKTILVKGNTHSQPSKLYGFSQRNRLLKPSEFTAVFRHKSIVISKSALTLMCLQSELDRPRLGIVIAKKQIKHAHQRNRVKRVFRESFRHRQTELPAVDVIILGRHQLQYATNELIFQQLQVCWQKLIHQTRTR